MVLFFYFQLSASDTNLDDRRQNEVLEYVLNSRKIERKEQCVHIA